MWDKRVDMPDSVLTVGEILSVLLCTLTKDEIIEFVEDLTVRGKDRLMDEFDMDW